MYSFAGVAGIKTYEVFRQLTPVEDGGEAILARVGVVRAKDSATAFNEARKLCKHPIIQPARH